VPVTDPLPAHREPLALLRLGVLAALLLLAYSLVAPHLTRLAFRPGLLVAVAVNMALLALLCAGLLPLREMRGGALAVAAAALGCAGLFTYLGWVPLSNLAKAVFAAGLGYWLAAQIGSLPVVVLIAVLSAVVDIVSVAVGPTRAILTHRPELVGYFTVALTWLGYHAKEAYTALGVSDLVFFCLYLGTARAFRLRVGATATGMALSVLVTVVAGLRVSAMPALPLLALAFLGVNADLLLGPRPAPRRCR